MKVRLFICCLIIFQEFIGNSTALKKVNDSFVDLAYYSRLQNVNESLDIRDSKLIKNGNGGFVNRFLYPIGLSIISATIFWSVFSFLPRFIRRNKIRPKLELDMYHIYSKLFFLFDGIMRRNKHSPSDFQKEIKGGLLTGDDIKLGLQNKCLNNSYLYDGNVNDFLLVVGENLYDISKSIDETVDRIFNFNSYLSSKEILLLEKIRKNLLVYDYRDYTRSAITVIGNQQLAPVNPSLSYRTNNIFELYQLFLELQHLIFKNKYLDRDIFITKVGHFYYSGQYKKCRNEIKKSINKFPEDKNILEFYSLLCDYMSDNKIEAYRKLNIVLKAKPHLVSERGFLNEILKDEKVDALLHQYYTEEEIGELKKVLAREKSMKERCKSISKWLMDYYDTKSRMTR
jgi:hypothetical protein